MLSQLLNDNGVCKAAPEWGKKNIFFFNFDFFGIQILREKTCKLQQFEIATTLRKSLI